ncbi:MAG TPA: transketolase C-terminal domain-containing protein [Thermoplasmata archaeon]|nr:transketolase C-terminal domain-containing protein [Thermoplasmata archaeon]
MTAARKTESLRDAYGKGLLELGERDPSLVVLDADLSGSTRTQLFGQKFPDRFFNVGVMEPTMMSIAAGLSLEGRTVFASTFAVFAAGQAYNFVRQSICYNRANVKIVATHGGVLVGGDGGTHQMLEDIGLMRGLPGMTVIVPADAPTTRAATLEVAERKGPAYVRLTRENLPVVTDGSFRIGHAAELRAGSDLTMVAAGALVARALDVAEELAKVGVSTRVLDFASIKPFDEASLLRAARDTGAILSLEEHSVLTGLGALVASTTSENYPVPVRRIGVPDVFGESGEPWALVDRFGMSVERIRDEAWELLRLRGKVQ